MSFLKKLGETAKSTASAIGSKSVELVNTGKLTVEKNNIKGKISKHFTDMGSMIYDAYKNGEEPNQEEIIGICKEIDQLELQIEEIDEKIKEERDKSKEQKDEAAEKAEEVKEEVAEKSKNVKENVTEKAGKVKEDVSEEADEIAEELDELGKKK